MGGFVGIQVVSRFLHHYMPSHVELCDHDNDHKEEAPHIHGHSHGHDGHESRRNSHGHYSRSRPSSHGSQLDGSSKSKLSNSSVTEASPLLSEHGTPMRPSPQINGSRRSHKVKRDRSRSRGVDVHERRPSMMEVPARVMSFVKDTKTGCEEGGKCFGYSDPCGQECFKHILKIPITPTNSRYPPLFRTTTGTFHRVPSVLDEEDETASPTLAVCSPLASRSHSREPMDEGCEEDPESLHHHHVAENSFMSIGLQTSIAIALHKLPEGFITYATNHANPSLGFSVFMALFIHNITEGFVMALPIFLALHSRLRAMLVAALLGGFSQPLGAGIAWAWFKIAGTEGHKPGSEIYGCMFAITAGIMASVALQLFTEGLGLNHNRPNLCIAFAFIGMAIMGISGALTS
jgi:ZIP family zinc transporter